MLWVIVGVASAIGLFIGGVLSVPASGSSNQGNGGVEGCTAACANLIAKRMQVCSARAAVASATAFRNSVFLTWAAASATSIAAAALVAVAAAVPIIGPILVAAAAVAAAAAAAYATYLLGRLTSASLALQAQTDGLRDAVRFEAEAITLVTNSCPAEEAARCITSLPACPV